MAIAIACSSTPMLPIGLTGGRISAAFAVWPAGDGSDEVSQTSKNGTGNAAKRNAVFAIAETEPYQTVPVFWPARLAVD
jgi:hypothetical protein